MVLRTPFPVANARRLAIDGPTTTMVKVKSCNSSNSSSGANSSNSSGSSNSSNSSSSSSNLQAPVNQPVQSNGGGQVTSGGSH